MKILGVLDRYVLRQWLTTFVLAALGIPTIAILINTAEFFGKLVDKGVTVPNILLGQLYMYPWQVSQYFPAAVLFATVFTLNAMGRHSELTAVKAGGVSFYRLVAPMLLLALAAVPVAFGLQELAAVSTTRQRTLQKQRTAATELIRFDFGYQSKSQWTWAVKEMQRSPARLRRGLLVEGPLVPGRPRWTLSADSASWSARHRQWLLQSGLSVMADSAGTPTVFRYETLRHKALTDLPDQLMDEQKKAEEMRIGEFRDYLDQLHRSGAKPGMLEVDLPLKYAIPFACLIIAMFGAPLSLTAPRAGAALGLAFALGTTLAYLTGTQIMKAIGGKGIVDPTLAAWSMNGVFFVLAVVLLVRVRS